MKKSRDANDRATANVICMLCNRKRNKKVREAIDDSDVQRDRERTRNNHKEGIMTPEEITKLRRKLVGAKSLLSRLTNRYEDMLRSSEPISDKIDRLKVLNAQIAALYIHFRTLGKELRKAEGRDR